MKTKTIILGLIIALSTGWAQAQDPVEITTTVTGSDKLPIAIPPFPTDAATLKYGSELARLMSADFAFQGEFNVLLANKYPPTFRSLPADWTKIDFEAWRNTEAAYLIHTTLRQEGAKMVAECRLFDVFSGQQVLGKRLSAKTAKDARLLAHLFADESVEFLLNPAGIASTEIAFSGSKGARVKEIYIADYDGANMLQVTHHNAISILPQFSPDGTRIAYFSYKDRFPFLYVYDRRTGQSTPLSTRSGLNNSPAWSPDSSKIALTLSKDGNTEIYIKNPDGTGEQRLTNDKGSDTSPCFSPDGRQIAFVSDRGGRASIYVMGADGSNQRRLYRSSGNAYDPIWSPDGNHIAFIGERSGEGLEVYMMDADGSNIRQLTSSGGYNESPTWSPDSRHIMFASNRSGKTQLHTVTIATGVVRKVDKLASLKAEGPTWGPRRLPAKR